VQVQVQVQDFARGARWGGMVERDYSSTLWGQHTPVPAAASCSKW
jgi:hypothetical protein